MRELLKSTDLKRLVLVAALLIWCVCLVAVRMERTGSGYYLFLIFNLVLACVPLCLSTALRLANHWRFPRAIQFAGFCLWLLFLPNAPYILTDILHLTRPASVAPAWYDLAMLLSCAGTGLVVGYLSLIDVQGIVARSFGTACGWLCALASLVLSGFAIYLGRFLRWNSWDVLVNPTRLFGLMSALLEPWSHLKAVAVTIIFGVLLTLGYLTLHVLLVRPERS
jgi:uncharacterized membrane protein